jgi:hypothetical protein
MATSDDITKFQELSDNDRVLCTTRDHTRDLMRSVQVMILLDEIRAIEQESLEFAGLDARRDHPLTRSTILVCALHAYKDQISDDLLALRESKGLL